jgi:hypothetical protein
MIDGVCSALLLLIGGVFTRRGNRTHAGLWRGLQGPGYAVCRGK